MPLLLFVFALAASPISDERDAKIQEALTSTDPLIALGAYSRVGDLIEHSEEPGAVWKYLERIEKEARHPLVRARGAFSLASRDAERGDVDKAMKRYAALGIIPIARAIGPFANTGGAAFGAPTPADDLAQDKKVSGLDREIAWQTIELDPDAELNLGPRITPTKETRSLFAVVVKSKTARPAALRIGSSGQLRVLWNGREVLREDVDRPLRLDQSVAGVQIEKGDNLLVVELGTLGIEASLRIRMTAPDGVPMTDLTYAVDNGSFNRAAKTKSKAEKVQVLDPLRITGGDKLTTLRAAVALETRTEAGDKRRKPTQLRQWLEELAGLVKNKHELATVYARLGKSADDATAARRAFDRALEQDPNCVEALLGLAALRREQGDDRTARHLLERARDADPKSDVVQRELLTFARDGAGGIAAELAILARARSVPTDGNLRLAADVYEERGDRAAAIKISEQIGDRGRALRLKSDLAWMKLAEDPSVVKERRDLALAALKLRPQSHALAEQYAMTLVAADEKARALAFAKERIKTFPARAEPLQLLARLHIIDGERAEALTALNAASLLIPHDADLQRTLRALATEDDALVKRYGIDAQTLAKDPPSADASRLGAHVAAATVAARFYDNGLARVMTDRVIRIHDAKKTQGLQSFSFPYSEGRERIEVLVAERFTKDGRREPALRIADRGPGGKQNGVYTDVAEKIVAFGTLNDGDTLHVRVRKEVIGQQNLFGDFFGMVEPIQSVVPVKRWRMVIEAPKNRALAIGGRGSFTKDVREEAEVRVHEIRVDDAAPIEVEPGMPPYLEVAEFVSVSTYGNWQALGAWYESLIAPQLVMDDDLKALAHKLTDGTKDDAEKVRRIYEYVVTSTRYVGIELGIHGWKPYPVTEVHRRRYGDCKDKASLLVVLLREAGVPANLALVRTANLGMVNAEPASMWLFNHAIAYVPSLDLFLDGTAEQSGWRELPTADQGGLSLIVGKHGNKPASELVTIPLAPADNNLNISDYVLHLAPDGTLAVKGKERFRGHANAEQRRDFADPATRREKLERHLSGALPGAQVQSIEVTDLSLAAAELGYDFTATLPRRAIPDASGALTMPVSLYPHDLVGAYAQQSTRKTDVYLDHPWRTRNVMRYVLPAGWRVEDLPAGGTVKSAHLSFTQNIVKTEDGFIVDEDTAILSRRISREEYAALRDAALKADALMKRKIRIVRVRS